MEHGWVVVAHIYSNLIFDLDLDLHLHHTHLLSEYPSHLYTATPASQTRNMAFPRPKPTTVSTASSLQLAEMIKLRCGDGIQTSTSIH